MRDPQENPLAEQLQWGFPWIEFNLPHRTMVHCWPGNTVRYSVRGKQEKSIFATRLKFLAAITNQFGPDNRANRSNSLAGKFQFGKLEKSSPVDDFPSN